MEKKIYITPVLSVHTIRLASGLLLSASDNDGNSLLEYRGTTSVGGVTSGDSRSDNAWDIWGDGDYDD